MDIVTPIRNHDGEEILLVGQSGQSLDGRIATSTGQSKYINGNAGLTHLHRLRSVVDAVLVGAGTACADDPILTVRHVAGESPARILLDPRGRVPDTAKMFAGDGKRRLVITGEDCGRTYAAGIEVLRLPTSKGVIAPQAIRRALQAQGFRRVLIEGGAHTLSGFLNAGCLDRLHVVVAPIILGGGKPSLDLGPIDLLDQAIRPKVTCHLLDDEVLFDCDLAAYRRGSATRS